MRQKNLRVIDLLHSFDKSHSESLTREDLRKGLLNMDIPLSNRSMDTLMRKLDLNKDGFVDFEELGTGWKEHVRRMTKWKRKAETQPGSSVSSRLRQLRETIRMRIEATHRRGAT
ncbi:mitochondrial substrate carrier family protein C-like [Babylonia areolata]|uniref:mitochondrial substrate carrier family protein C-like n=1 Tax=Babylonia areolata TaxID=304850 RepID=UPI003FD4CF1E